MKDDFKAILMELRFKEGNELVDEFERILRKRIPHDIRDLSESISRKDIESIGKKAHFLTTTLVTLKFTQGVEICDALQKTVQKSALDESIELANRLIQYLHQMINEI